MVKLQKNFKEIDKVDKTTKRKNDLDIKAESLEKRFFKKTPSEQRVFFKNIVMQSAELKAYREEIASIKKGGVSL